MFALAPTDSTSSTELLEGLQEQARALLQGERDPVANAANLSSLIFHTCPSSTGPGSTG